MKIYSIVIVLTGLILLASCSEKHQLTVVFYNVENLFDTIDTPFKIDEEFTPLSKKEWNTERYMKKLNDLAHVIASIDSVQLPAIVGLCEVENDVVLNDLVANPQLQNGNYQVVWQDGADKRGIDVAMLYNPAYFILNSFESIQVKKDTDSTFATRDLLLVNGELNKEEFYIFVSHWPSRKGGQLVSNPNRALVAGLIKQRVDAIHQISESANIIIMGDFNDEPSDSSVSVILGARPNSGQVKSTDLVDLMYNEQIEGLGSYMYRGDWDMLDHLVVSGNLINKTKGLKTSIDNGYIFHQPFMEYVNNKGEMSPNRTYGRSYYGGISDHFPVYMTLNK